MNLVEIINRFPTEIDAIKYFESIRWKKGIKCPYCYSEKIGSRNIDNRWHCKECKKTFFVTTKTNLNRTHISLRTWLMSFALITDAKKGVSALQLKRNLGLNYETAFNMEHKIRDLMSIENKEIKLKGVVEMDETYVGGKPRKFADYSCFRKNERKELDDILDNLTEKGFKIKEGSRKVVCDKKIKRGRGSEKKTPVTGIVSRDGEVVAEVMKHLTSDDLKAMILKYVNTNKSVLFTDDFKGYNKKIDNIIEHVKIDHHKMFSYRGINTNTIESFWAFIKRQIMGQHHHVSVKYLPKYVAETVFKFNNRNKDDMFETLLELSMLEKNT